MLRGIDVSGYQALGATYSHPNVETAYSGSDFVLAKATQGTPPKNRYMTAQLQPATLARLSCALTGRMAIMTRGAQQFGQGNLLTASTQKQEFTLLCTLIQLDARR